MTSHWVEEEEKEGPVPFTPPTQNSSSLANSSLNLALCTSENIPADFLTDSCPAGRDLEEDTNSINWVANQCECICLNTW